MPMENQNAGHVRRPKKLAKTLLERLVNNECLKKMKFCPKCGSTNVFYASGLPQLWSIWECRDCGYRGALILEDGEFGAKLGEEWQQKKHANRTEDGE